MLKDEGIFKKFETKVKPKDIESYIVVLRKIKYELIGIFITMFICFNVFPGVIFSMTVKIFL